MKYRVFASIEDADTVSRAEAIARGCSGVTTHWWMMCRHEDGRAALALEDHDTIEGVTVPVAAMVADGWIGV